MNLAEWKGYVPEPKRLVVPPLALAQITGCVNSAFEALAQAAQLLTPATEEDPRAIVAALRSLYGHLEGIVATVEIIMEENGHGS
jgi:hypothetical protein